MASKKEKKKKRPTTASKSVTRLTKPPVLVPDEVLLDSDDEGVDESSTETTDELDGLEPEVESLPVAIPKTSDREIEVGIKALTSSDPLKRYIEEIKRYALLTPEQELELALDLHRTGSIESARRLVQANLRLVVKIAFEYRSFYSNVLDLIQEGNVGLMKAVSKFDPSKGAKLSYYSSWWIRSYILKYLLDNFRLIKVGTTQAQKKLFYHLMREKQRLEAQGITAGPKLLAERLDVREKDVIEMQNRLSSSGAELSIDAPGRGEEGEATQSLVSKLSDQRESADEALARDQWLQILHEVLPEFETELGEREQKLLKERILAEEPKTLQEVADAYGLTRERARQIEVKVIAKLRDFLTKKLGDNIRTDFST